MITKSAARKHGRQQRANLTSQQVLERSAELVRKVEPSWLHYPRHHIFWPIPGKKEVHTLDLAHQLSQHKEVYLPKMDAANRLTHHLWQPGDVLVQNEWGIYEPSNQGISTQTFWETNIPTLVWIPLLAFDRNGFRVGYGKGFYDQFLQNAQHARKVGLSLFGPLENTIAHDHWDIRLDACVCPDGIWTF